MIIVIVHHWCKPEMIDKARRRIDANGDSSSEAPGFLFRYRLEKGEDSLRISTVSGWESREAYRAWKDTRNAYDASVGAESPYERAVNEIFEVAKIHDGVRSESKALI